MMKHKSQLKHPEVPERMTSIIEHLRATGLLARAEHLNGVSLTTMEKLLVAEVHSRDYINFIENVWPEDAQKPQIYIKDTYVNEFTAESAICAVACTLAAAERVAQGE